MSSSERQVDAPRPVCIVSIELSAPGLQGRRRFTNIRRADPGTTPLSGLWWCGSPGEGACCPPCPLISPYASLSPARPARDCGSDGVQSAASSGQQQRRRQRLRSALAYTCERRGRLRVAGTGRWAVSSKDRSGRGFLGCRGGGCSRRTAIGAGLGEAVARGHVCSGVCPAPQLLPALGGLAPPCPAVSGTAAHRATHPTPSRLAPPCASTRLAPPPHPLVPPPSPHALPAPLQFSLPARVPRPCPSAPRLAPP